MIEYEKGEINKKVKQKFSFKIQSVTQYEFHTFCKSLYNCDCVYDSHTVDSADLSNTVTLSELSYCNTLFIGYALFM